MEEQTCRGWRVFNFGRVWKGYCQKFLGRVGFQTLPGPGFGFWHHILIRYYWVLKFLFWWTHNILVGETLFRTCLFRKSLFRASFWWRRTLSFHLLDDINLDISDQCSVFLYFISFIFLYYYTLYFHSSMTLTLTYQTSVACFYIYFPTTTGNKL